MKKFLKRGKKPGKKKKKKEEKLEEIPEAVAGEDSVDHLDQTQLHDLLPDDHNDDEEQEDVRKQK